MGPRILRSLGAYSKAVIQNAVISTLLFIAGFALAGMPWWFLTGMICGILNMLPSVGSVLALGLALLIQFFASDSWMRLGVVAGVWLTIQIIEGFILSPRAAGRAGINPVLSIFLVLAAGLAFGPVGVILAVPVAAVFLIIFRTVRSARD